jgi:hypothetical protein
MTMKPTALVWFSAALYTGAPAGASPPGPNLPPPLTLTLAGPARVVPGQELVLTLMIRRPVPSGTAMVLDVALPDGVVLLDRAPRERIVDARHALIQRQLRLAVRRVPDADLVVTVQARSRVMGVFATAVYRFGRPEERPAGVGLGPELRGPGGVSLGRPVVLTRPDPHPAVPLGPGAPPGPRPTVP